MKNFLLLFITCICCMFMQVSGMANATTLTNNENCILVSADKNTSDWTEVQSVVIPFDTPIHEGVTKNGNPKYYFTFESIGDVTISESSAKKFRERSTNIELVKWYSASKDSYRYSTRQVRAKKSKVPNINLTDLF